MRSCFSKEQDLKREDLIKHFEFVSSLLLFIMLLLQQQHHGEVIKPGRKRQLCKPNYKSFDIDKRLNGSSSWNCWASYRLCVCLYCWRLCDLCWGFEGSTGWNDYKWFIFRGVVFFLVWGDISFFITPKLFVKKTKPQSWAFSSFNQKQKWEENKINK